MTTLASAVSIGDNQLLIDTPLAAGQVPGWVKIDSEMLNVGGQHFRTGTTLVLSEPAKATHSQGATVTYAGNPFDPTFVAATAGGGAAEAGTVVVTPPLEVDVAAALEGANAPDGSNPVATIADLTIDEVLSNGDTVLDGQEISVPDGAAFAISGLTTPSPSVVWNPDGSLSVGSGQSNVTFGADESVVIASGNSTIQIAADDTVSLITNGTEIEVSPLGVISLGDAVTIDTDAVTTIATGVIRLQGLPTADPATGDGALWLDSGVLTISS